MTQSSERSDLTRDALYWLLSYVLIEIRATDDLSKAQILADIFHNVPAKLGKERPTATIVAEILDKASRHEWEGRIKRMLEVAIANTNPS